MIGRCRAVSLILMALPCLGLAGKLPAASAPASPVDAAKQILETSGIRGGLIVLVGCGDGALVAALSAAKGFLTQGLDVDPARVQKAREAFDAAGLTERASATAFDGEHLPYADNMVNLLVLDDRGRVNDAEIQRVLCPYGVACARTGGAWAVIARKPWPADMDEWSHYLHGPDGNPVANDTQVGPPDHLKWDAGPEVCKSHSILPSVQAAVSAGGRVFSIADEGPIPLPHILPARWALTARDAFNGTLLWQRPLDVWQAINAQKRGLTPTDLARRLVADHDRVYVTLDIFGPFQALDAATGKTLQVYKETEFAEEAILRDGVLYIVAEAAPPDIGLRRQLGIALPQPVAKRLLAVRADTGQVLWNKCDDDTFGLFPLTLAAGDHGLCFQTDKAICCLDPASGSKVWQTPHPAHYPRPGWSAPTLVAQGDIVLCADGGTTDNAKERAGSVVALSAATGQPLWSGEAAEGASSPVDVFVSQGLAWIGEQKARNAQDYMHGRDLLTGAVTREIPPSDAWTGEHHHRCYRDKATGQYILAGRTGVEFIDLKSGEILPHPWIRGTCHYGIMPCNGLLYVMPHECGCYLESKLNGFLALAPKGAAPAFTPPADARLEKGPAYGKIDVRPASSAAGASSDWPTFRHDNARSGYAPSPVPAALGQVWSADLGGGLTAPVCADGRLYVAQKDRNAVACLDAATGKTVWRYIAGASVDSPPTIADGLAVFGARDGWVYAVRAADGQLAWRLRAAPAERWLVSYDRLESPWPVSGSVLVENGPSAGSGQAVAYCAAGRTSYLDDGMTLCKIELATGRLLAEKTYYSRDPDSGRPVNLYEPRYTDVLGGRELPGLLPDVLSADAANLYMRGVAIGRDLAIQEEQNQSHIYSSLGFLDDSWWERSYWIFGEHFYSGLAARFVAGFRAPAGKLLTADDQTVYAYLDSDLAKGLMMKTPGLFAESKTPALTEKVMKGKTQAGKGKLRNVSTATVAPAWSVDTPFYGVSMAIAGDTLFVAGPQRGNEVEAAQYLAECPTNECVPPPVAQSALDAFNGKQGSTIWAVNKSDGAQRAAFRLESRPVFDGLIAAQGRLFITTTDGKALCLGPGAAQPLPPAGDSAAVSPSSDSSAGKSPASANSRKASKADKPRKEGGKRRASRDKAA